MHVAEISERIKMALGTVLPEASFDVLSRPDGGVEVKIAAESFVAALTREGREGLWDWSVYRSDGAATLMAFSSQGVDRFDAAAVATIGVLAGAVAHERMNLDTCGGIL